MHALTEIRPQLFISNREIGGSAELRESGFDAVLCLDSGSFVYPHPAGIDAVLKPISLNRFSPLEFEAALISLKWLSKTHQKVLVHCASGVSRSVAVVAAFLVDSEGLPPQQALDEVAGKREGIGFVDRKLQIAVLSRGE